MSKIEIYSLLLQMRTVQALGLLLSKPPANSELAESHARQVLQFNEGLNDLLTDMRSFAEKLAGELTGEKS